MYLKFDITYTTRSITEQPGHRLYLKFETTYTPRKCPHAHTTPSLDHKRLLPHRIPLPLAPHRPYIDHLLYRPAFAPSARSAFRRHYTASAPPRSQYSYFSPSPHLSLYFSSLPLRLLSILVSVRYARMTQYFPSEESKNGVKLWAFVPAGLQRGYVFGPSEGVGAKSGMQHQVNGVAGAS